jgi:hypothetical protein
LQVKCACLSEEHGRESHRTPLDMLSSMVRYCILDPPPGSWSLGKTLHLSEAMSPQRFSGASAVSIPSPGGHPCGGFLGGAHMEGVVEDPAAAAPPRRHPGDDGRAVLEQMVLARCKLAGPPRNIVFRMPQASETGRDVERMSKAATAAAPLPLHAVEAGRLRRQERQGADSAWSLFFPILPLLSTSTMTGHPSLPCIPRIQQESGKESSGRERN